MVLPVYEIRIQYWLVRAKLLFASRKRQLEAKIKFFNSLCPVGEDPTRYTVGVKEWAGECRVLMVNVIYGLELELIARLRVYSPPFCLLQILLTTYNRS